MFGAFKSDEMSMKIILSSNLASILKKRGMTPSQLARATGVPNSTIQNWLSGQDPRNLVHLKKISDYLEVTIDQILFEPPRAVGEKRSALEDYSKEINAGTFEVILRKKK
jgi:transcriptional regulator with XRE-family HTH domain